VRVVFPTNFERYGERFRAFSIISTRAFHFFQDGKNKPDRREREFDPGFRDRFRAFVGGFLSTNHPPVIAISAGGALGARRQAGGWAIYSFPIPRDGIAPPSLGARCHPGLAWRHPARSPPCRREHIYARGYISDPMTSRCIQPSRRHGVPRAAVAAPSPGSWFFRGRFHRPCMPIPAFPLPFPFYLLKGAAGTAPGPLSPRGDGRRAGRHFKIQVILE